MPVHSYPLWERLTAQLLICIFAGVVGWSTAVAVKRAPWVLVIVAALALLTLLVSYSIRRARADGEH